MSTTQRTPVRLAQRGQAVETARTRRDAAPGTRHAAFVAGELLLLVLAGALAAVVWRHPGPLPGDAGLALDEQHALLPHRALTAFLDAFSTMEWPQYAAIAMAVVIVLLLLLRRKLDAIMALLTAVVAIGSSYLTAEIVRRPRPSGYGLHVLRHIQTYYSFPSGHVVHALAFFGFLLFLTYQTRRPAAWLWIVRLVLLALIVLMGPSRILEGEHWPSDVVEGLLFGVLWLILGIHLFKWARQRWPRLLSHDEQQALIR